MRLQKTTDEFTRALAYKIKKPRSQQVRILERIFDAQGIAYNKALELLKQEVAVNRAMPSSFEFKKHAAKVRNATADLDLIPSNAVQAIFNKLHEAVSTQAKDKELYATVRKELFRSLDDGIKAELTAATERKSSSAPLTARAKEAQTYLNDESKKRTLEVALSHFSTRKQFTSISYFDGFYDIRWLTDDAGNPIEPGAFQAKHGSTLFAKQPEKLIGELRFFAKAKKKQPGRVKRVELCKKRDGYYAVISFSISKDEMAKPASPGGEVGIDLGNKILITLNDGRQIERFPESSRLQYKRLCEKRRALQQALSIKHRTYLDMNGLQSGTPPSRNYADLKAKLTRVDEQISRMRDWHNHRITNQIINEFDHISVENVNVRELMRRPKNDEIKKTTRSHMSSKNARTMRRNMANGSWGELKQQLQYKSEWRGRTYIEVEARGTTQTCSACGYLRGEEDRLYLEDRTHVCPKCGFTADRDVNAAKNVLKRSKA
jgi:IS605 OrfB family transposase